MSASPVAPAARPNADEVRGLRVWRIVSLRGGPR